MSQWSSRDRDGLSIASVLFEDFLIANRHLVQRVVEEMRGEPAMGKELLLEIEARARVR